MVKCSHTPTIHDRPHRRTPQRMRSQKRHTSRHATSGLLVDDFDSNDTSVGTPLAQNGNGRRPRLYAHNRVPPPQPLRCSTTVAKSLHAIAQDHISRLAPAVWLLHQPINEVALRIRLEYPHGKGTPRTDRATADQYAEQMPYATQVNPCFGSLERSPPQEVRARKDVHEVQAPTRDATEE